jgi:hypothetical protein
MIHERVNNSSLTYPNYREDRTVRDYYFFILDVFRNFIKRYNVEMNITLSKVCEGARSFSIQLEHTLVKKSAASSCPSSFDSYVVRIDHYEKHNEHDFILEYSMPNIEHIKMCKEFNEFVKKIIYLPPLFFNKELIFSQPKKRDVMTSFFNVFQDRRKKIIEDLRNFDHENVTGLQGEDLEKVLKETKVLINIHQSDFHHTVEELRILPALRCGAIVIAEDSPLRECIPYQKFIIWTTYDNIVNETQRVLSNYEEIHSSIFTQELKFTLTSMEEKIYTDMREKVF